MKMIPREIELNEILQNDKYYANYYIFGNKKLIATSNCYDNASLISETLASHSPYYHEIDVIHNKVLILHYDSSNSKNDRTNHLK